jgi:predicted nucleic acid-binding Zn ribbon protein
MAKKPLRLSSTLAILLKARGMEARLSQYRILGKWEKTVGRVISSHARPSAVRNGKLFLTVDSPAWMQQLSMLKPEIIEKVNRELGNETIRGITLGLGEVPASDNSPEQKQVLPELTAEEREAIEHYVGGVRDADLRQRIRRVIEKDLTSKKTRK